MTVADDVFGILFSEREIIVRSQFTAQGYDLFFLYGVIAFPFNLLPVQADSSFLPGREIVEVDAVLKQQLVLISDRLTFELAGRCAYGGSFFTEHPVAV